MRSKKEDLYLSATEKWGVTAQLIVALEELAELSVEIAKVANNKHKENYDNLVDELADARIMIEQVEFILNLSGKVEARKIYKLDRLEKIINGGA